MKTTLALGPIIGLLAILLDTALQHVLSACFIIIVLESLKHKPNGVYPEGVSADRRNSSGATEVSEDNTNPEDYNVDRFFSVLSENKLNQINPLFIVLTRYSYLDTL